MTTPEGGKEKRIALEKRMDLKGKRVVITGAAQGIGRLTAEAVAQEGADVIGVDLSVEQLGEVGENVRASGQEFRALVADLGKPESVGRLVEAISRDEFHVLINNAGVTCSGPFDEVDFAVWRRAVEINLLGAMQLTHGLLPLMKKNAPGHIVNIASVAGKFGPEGLAAYAASKHGLVGWSSSLRCELMNEGIGVSWVCPIFTRTRMIEGFEGNWLTPVLPPEKVVRAIVRAIRWNHSEVWVPRGQQLLAGVLPHLVPSLSRWVATRFQMNGNWKDLKKGIPKDVGKG